MSESTTFDLPIVGMTCASCAGRVERALSKVIGATAVSVNLATEQARIQAPSDSLPALMDAVQQAGYSVPQQSLELSIDGMTCASCVGRVERALTKVAGVKSVSVNLANERAHLELLGHIDPQILIAAVTKAGYNASVWEVEHPTDNQQARLHRERWILLAAIALALPLVLPMLLQPFGVHWMLPAWAQFALATPVQFIFGARFYVAAWKAVRAGAGNMDLLVALGTSAGYGLSLYEWATAAPGTMPHLYFEASAVVIALVLLGKYLESRAKRQTASAIRALEALRPERAIQVIDGREQDVAISALRLNDLVMVKPGERFPVDGEVVEGQSHADEALISGESLPVPKQSGGQIGDCGFLQAGASRFDVRDTTKTGGAFLHHGVQASGSLKVGAELNAEVDADVRHATSLNHSATHLLHAALRQVLGEHVQQKGSLVDSQRLRFDFSHFEAIKPEQLKALEDIVNAEVRKNTAVETEETDIETAKKKGAMALFGEKYGDNVRVLSMGGGFSVELCGGIHANRTGDIALLKITSEGGVAAGVRRIEAVTGAAALAYLNAAEDQLKEAATLVKGNRDNLLDKLSAVIERNRLLEKQLEQLQAKAASAAGDDLSAAALDVKGVKVLAVRLDGQDGKALLALVDQLKNKLGRAVILLGSVHEDKVVLVAGVTKDLTGQLKAGDLMKQAAAAVGGKGGGRPDMAQGGGVDAGALDAALALTVPFVEAGI